MPTAAARVTPDDVPVTGSPLRMVVGGLAVVGGPGTGSRGRRRGRGSGAVVVGGVAVVVVSSGTR